MRHGMKGRKLGRTSSHRLALFRNQLASFVEHERIITTLPKAKELRPLAEKMVTLGRQSTLHARRQVLRWIPNADAVRKLFDDISPRFAERNGGYTRIVKLGPRPGDGAEMAVLEFVDYVLTPKVEAGEERKPKASLLERAKAAVTRRPKAEKAAETAETAEAGEKKVAAKGKSKPKPAAAKAKTAKPKAKPAAAKTAKPKREGKSEAKGAGKNTSGAPKGKSSAGGTRKSGRASSGGKKGTGR